MNPEAAKLLRGFEFPPLGDTGAGDPLYPWDGFANTPVWSLPSNPSYGVSHQHDRPACAFRCYYPGGGSPCDLQTAMRFVAHVSRVFATNPVETGRSR